MRPTRLPLLALLITAAACHDPVTPPAAVDGALPCPDAAPATPQIDARVDAARPDAREPTPDPIPETRDPDAVAAALAGHCAEAVGPARIERLADDLAVAVGFDLANTIALATPAGRVIFDVGMSPARAEVVRDALDAELPGPVAALVYTHSHIDHIGGASVWRDGDAPIWSTAAVPEGVIEQYGAFRPSEVRRGAKQFGQSVPDEALPCSALGRRADVEAALVSGVRLPTETFTDAAALDFGGVSVELYRAPGETADQLFAWIPHLGALLPGDNWYAAFPNLYTIRGTRPRDVDAWIASLDAMRRLDPEMLVPSHTRPIVGRDAVRAALTAHRDAIQWVRDQVVRGANAGLTVDAIAATAGLPPHLIEVPSLAERYGQTDWSARAIYGNRVGWFDGRTATLYPAADAIAREVALMGGPDAVLGAARGALAGGDPRFALHLLDKLRRAGVAPAGIDGVGAEARTALGLRVENTNGRAWLLEEARRLAGEPPPAQGEAVLDDALLDAIPVEAVLRVLPTRLRAAEALERHVALALELDGRRFTLTVRRGIAEVIEGDPLPGTPPPTATVTADGGTFVRMALGVLPAAQALGEGRLMVDDLGAALVVLGLFDGA